MRYHAHSVKKGNISPLKIPRPDAPRKVWYRKVSPETIISEQKNDNSEGNKYILNEDL